MTHTNKVEIGTNLTGNWGGYMPLSLGVVAAINGDTCTVKWDDMGDAKYRISELKSALLTSEEVNSNIYYDTIGVWIEDESQFGLGINPGMVD